MTEHTVQIYNVGPEELWSDDDLKNVLNDPRYLWAVYWYSTGSYDGDGTMYLFSKEGKLFAKDLCHCSCFGPLDNWSMEKPLEVTLTEFFKDRESIFESDVKPEIKQKVAELLSWDKGN